MLKIIFLFFHENEKPIIVYSSFVPPKILRKSVLGILTRKIECDVKSLCADCRPCLMYVYFMNCRYSCCRIKIVWLVNLTRIIFFFACRLYTVTCL